MRFKAAVVIPVYKQFSALDQYEKISLVQALKIFISRDVIFITYKQIDVRPYITLNEETITSAIYFDSLYFADIAGYNKLLKSLVFYESFSGYEYILICQLDVFVFEDLLDLFIEKKLDYIGAPWFEGFDKAPHDSKIIGVGNGGFSLRKVSSFISILKAFSFFSKNKFLHKLNTILVHHSSILKIIKNELKIDKNKYPSILPWKFSPHEDYYWCAVVSEYFPWLRISSVEDAIPFAFEVNPDVLLKLNNENLPMGAHAWQKYNNEFWKPIIEKFGYIFVS